MKRNVPKFARVRGGIVGVLGAAALLAACEAKMPTSAEIVAMDVGAVEHRVGALGLVPDEAVYIVDGKRVTRTEAVALKPEQIASVEVSKSDTTKYVEIHTTAVRRVAGTQELGKARAEGVRGADSVRGGAIVIRDGVDRLRPIESEPLIIIDGVRSTAVALKALDRTSIKTVNVIKGAAAEREFGPDAKRGVITVVTGAKQ